MKLNIPFFDHSLIKEIYINFNENLAIFQCLGGTIVIIKDIVNNSPNINKPILINEKKEIEKLSKSLNFEDISYSQTNEKKIDIEVSKDFMLELNFSKLYRIKNQICDYEFSAINEFLISKNQILCELSKSKFKIEFPLLDILIFDFNAKTLEFYRHKRKRLMVSQFDNITILVPYKLSKVRELILMSKKEVYKKAIEEIKNNLNKGRVKAIKTPYGYLFGHMESRSVLSILAKFENPFFYSLVRVQDGYYVCNNLENIDLKLRRYYIAEFYKREDKKAGYRLAIGDGKVYSIIGYKEFTDMPYTNNYKVKAIHMLPIPSKKYFNEVKKEGNKIILKKDDKTYTIEDNKEYMKLKYVVGLKIDGFIDYESDISNLAYSPLLSIIRCKIEEKLKNKDYKDIFYLYDYMASKIAKTIVDKLKPNLMEIKSKFLILRDKFFEIED